MIKCTVTLTFSELEQVLAGLEVLNPDNRKQTNSKWRLYKRLGRLYQILSDSKEALERIQASRRRK